MKTMMFSVFDIKAAVYGTPFFMPREAAAIRAFGDLVNDERSTVSKHPEDYVLFHIGDFEDDTANIEVVKPRSLVTGASMVRPTSVERFGPEGMHNLTESNTVNGEVVR